MRILSILINLGIFLSVAVIHWRFFHKDGAWDFSEAGVFFRYFTVQSNILCALAACAMAAAQIAGNVPGWVLLFKYLGTVAVTVTLMTVLIYLGPAYGYKLLLSGRDLYLHLIGPVLAILSFLLLEKKEMHLGTALLGLLPVLLYGMLYLWKVVYCPEEKRWEDFYGFNKDGKWPVSYGIMIAGTLVICLLFYFL